MLVNEIQNLLTSSGPQGMFSGTIAQAEEMARSLVVIICFSGSLGFYEMAPHNRFVRTQVAWLEGSQKMP
jgi:hypothetical protein